METQPIVSNSGRAGRPPLPPELNGKNGGIRRQRWYGIPAHYSRAQVYQFAYDTGVDPTPTKMQRAHNLTLEDILGETDVPIQYVSRWNRYRGYLTARHLVPPDLEEMFAQLGSHEMKQLQKGQFWIVWKLQPTRVVDFRIKIHELVHIRPIPGCSMRAPGLFVTPQPGSELHRVIDRRDSLNNLTASMLWNAAAREQHAQDAEAAAFMSGLRIICRIACVAPFAEFGDEFVEDLMLSMTPAGHPVPIDWRSYAKSKMGEYRRLIRHGRESGFLTYNKRFPQGRNNEELATLRYADKINHVKVHAAFDSYLNDKTKIPPRCVRLRSLFAHPSANLYG